MDKTKRNLTKALGVAGASSVVWKKPVIDTVTLPAHAATSGGGFVVDSAVGSQSGSEAAAVCNSEGLGFSVSGTVSAANGQDLAGVSLTIEFTGQRLFEPLNCVFYYQCFCLGTFTILATSLLCHHFKTHGKMPLEWYW